MSGAFDWASLDGAFPWDRVQKLRDFLKPESRVLALSGADAALLSALGHPPEQVVLWDGQGTDKGPFDLAVGLFAPCIPEDALAALKSGGYLLAEQLAAGTAAETMAALCRTGGIPAAYCLENERERFLLAGYSVNYCDQAFAEVPFDGADALAAYIAGRAQVFGMTAGEAEKAAEELFAARAGRGYRDAEARFLLIVRKRKKP